MNPESPVIIPLFDRWQYKSPEAMAIDFLMQVRKFMYQTVDSQIVAQIFLKTYPIPPKSAKLFNGKSALDFWVSALEIATYTLQKLSEKAETKTKVCFPPQLSVPSKEQDSKYLYFLTQKLDEVVSKEPQHLPTKLVHIISRCEVVNYPGLSSDYGIISFGHVAIRFSHKMLPVFLKHSKEMQNWNSKRPSPHVLNAYEMAGFLKILGFKKVPKKITIFQLKNAISNEKISIKGKVGMVVLGNQGMKQPLTIIEPHSGALMLQLQLPPRVKPSQYLTEVHSLETDR